MSRKTGVILSYVMMIFEIASTLLLTPFILRTLGQAEYGVYRLAGTINGYLLLLDLGIGNAIIRYISKFRAENNLQEERRFLGIATVYYFVIAGIVLIVGTLLVTMFPTMFATGLTAEEVALGQKLLGISMINSAITLGTAAYTNVILAYEKFAISKGSSIIQIVLRMGLTVIALKAGMGSLGIVCVNLLMTVLCRGFFVAYVLLCLKLFPALKGTKPTFIKEITVYSSLVLLQMLATQLNSSVAQLLMGALVKSSSSILGIYGVGLQIVQYYQSIGSAFTNVLMPGIVRLVESDASSERLTQEMIRIGRIIFMVLGLIWGGFLVEGQQFIKLWAGKENISAYFVAIILMTSYALILTETIGSQMLWAKNEHKEQAVLKLASVLINVLVTIALIQWNPLLGSTIGTFISLVIGDIVVLNVIIRKKLHINLCAYYKGIFKGIVPALAIAVFVGLGANLIPTTGWVGFCAKICLVVLAYGVCMLLFGMNSYEKKLVFSTIKNILPKR